MRHSGVASSPDENIAWLVDTGASEDLIGQDVVRKNNLKCSTMNPPRKFATAGGIIDVSEKATVDIKELGLTVTPWVADTCPELLSVGKRIQEGFSFFWPKQGQPYLIDSNNKVLKLDVRNNIPFIPAGGVRTSPNAAVAKVIEAMDMTVCVDSIKRKAEDIVVPAVAEGSEEDESGNLGSSEGEEEPPLNPSQRLEHLLTHMPKRKDCDTCQRAKMKAKPRYRGSYRPQVSTWGELVTADHVSGNGFDFAIGDEIGAIVLKDAHTGLVGYYGVKDKTWETTKWAIREFQGTRKIQLLYTDGAPEIARAARSLDILQRTSTPGVPQNNGVAEREVQECIRGLRALLLAAGLPTAFWVHAAETFGFLKNVTENSEGTSAWEKTHGSKFSGLRIPFGSKVYFIPSPTKDVSQGKMEPSAQVGVFAGYALAPGCTWTGDYLVWLLDDFADLSLKRNAVIRSPKLSRPHRTRNVEVPTGAISFPLKAWYEVCNSQVPAETSADGIPLPRSVDQWSQIDTWWVRTNRMPRKYRYSPCLESGGPEIDTLSPWRLTVKMGKDGCAETLVDNWKTAHPVAENAWTGLTIFSTHPTAMEISMRTTVGRKQNFAESGSRMADMYDSRAQTADFDRRTIENKPWDGDTPPIPLDGALDTDFFRGEDGIWRVRSTHADGRGWKVDRNGVRWNKARLRPQRESSRPVDVSVRNWHTRLSQAQKRSFHKRRRIVNGQASDENDDDDAITHPTGGVPVGRSAPPVGSGGVDCEMADDDELGTVQQDSGGVNEHDAQHFDISTPVPSAQGSEHNRTNTELDPVEIPVPDDLNDNPVLTPRDIEDPDKTPVPTPRSQRSDNMSGESGHIRSEPSVDAPVRNKRRKTEVEIPRPPGIIIPQTTSPPQLPGSSGDHIRDNMSPKHESSSSSSESGSSNSSETSGSSSESDSSSSDSHESMRSRSGRGSHHREREYRNTSVYSPVFVARKVSHKERREVPKAQAAMQKEWDNLRNKGCWDESNPRDWHVVRKEAKARGKTVHMGRLVPLCVEKNFELSPDDPARKYKGRVVFQGNMVKDQDYADAEFENLGSSPATMEASKSVDAYGCLEGHGIQTADAEQAYIQADMKGKDTWILIPEEDRPAWWKDRFPYLKMPVVLMKKALYGHPDAGSYWEQKADQQAKAVGFKEIDDWPSTYYHEKLRLMLIIYVDDFKLAGPVENIEKGWSLLSKGIKIGTPEIVDEKGVTYLGCKQRVFKSRDKSGNYRATMEYDMKEFVQSCIDRYVEMAGIGSEPKHYSTPMLPESASESGGVIGICPWCERVPKHNKKTLPDPVDEEFDGFVGSTFAGVAGKIVMKLLWVARICRFDIMKAVTHLASFTSKWEPVHDIKLKRLMGYLAGTKEYCLYGWIGDRMEDLDPCLYADSDFAGCTTTRKSTSGMVHQLTGPNSCFPLMAASRKQNCVSNSTAEAELIATCTAVRNVGLPALNIWDRVLKRKAKLTLYEDNTAMIKMLKNGLSPSMRYLGRTHAVSIAAMKEIIDTKEIEIKYIRSKNMKADIMTKGFSGKLNWDNARRAVLTGERSEFMDENMVCVTEASNVPSFAGIHPKHRFQ